ncbi:DNA (cytosine-5-)-methyltransferase [Candidatus Dependentiae bacterium]|nr:MAG: DNA (cytosine-5-)-methyltransferase [Candidatus Dependentiae bacterium]
MKFPIDIKHRPVSILSLFDGYGGGIESFKRAGFKIKEYHAFEIDKYCIKVAKANHPEIIHHGCVKKADFKKFRGIDFLIGGSPCQGFSFVGRGLGFRDPRSRLVLEFFRAKYESAATFFLLENTKMRENHSGIISELMGVEYIELNSAKFSAQNRIRNYWCNWKVNSVNDLRGGVMLSSILENRIPNIAGARIVGRRLNSKGNREDKNKSIPVKQYIELRADNKANCLTTAFKDSVIAYKLSDKELAYMNRKVADGRDHWDFKHHSDSKNPKSSCLVANLFKGVPYNVLIDRFNNEILYRKFTRVECERLQTLPDNYTELVSETQAYKMIGNGWNIETIKHILNSEDL